MALAAGHQIRPVSSGLFLLNNGSLVAAGDFNSGAKPVQGHNLDSRRVMTCVSPCILTSVQDVDAFGGLNRSQTDWPPA